MTTQNTQAVQTRTVDSAVSLMKMLSDAMPEMQRIAPKYVNISRLVSLAIEAKQRNQLLASCSPVSVLNFCKKCAEWGTDRVGAGGVWPVPFWNTKTNSYDMTPIPDWRLLVEKAKKAKAIKHCTAEVVLETDVFEYERGLEPRLVHRPTQRLARGKPVAVYVVYVLPDGTKDFMVMDWEAEILPIRNRSKAWQAWLDKKRECPWLTDEQEMGKKTAIKRCMKLFEGASIELTQMIDSDNAVNGYIDLTPAAVREPVAMPVVTEAAPEAEPKAPDSGNAQSGAPAADPGENQERPAVLTVTGCVEKMTDKPTATGGTRYGIKVSKNWYNTFDDGLAKKAKEANDRGVEVEIAYVVNDKGYKDITALRIPGDMTDDSEDERHAVKDGDGKKPVEQELKNLM